MIESAEGFLRELGFFDVRVRHHELKAGALARIDTDIETFRAELRAAESALAGLSDISALERRRDEVQSALTEDRGRAAETRLEFECLLQEARGVFVAPLEVRSDAGAVIQLGVAWLPRERVAEQRRRAIAVAVVNGAPRRSRRVGTRNLAKAVSCQKNCAQQNKSEAHLFFGPKFDTNHGARKLATSLNL